MFSIAPEVARELGAALLGTFHIRQGDQRLLDETGRTPAAWFRVLRVNTELEQDQTVYDADFQLAPRFDGDISGFQLGLDVAARRRDDGSMDRIGLMYGRAEANGDVFGEILARSRVNAGEFDMEVESVGLYVTHMGRRAWYVDVVLMHNWLSAVGRSSLDVGGTTKGESTILSIEAGRQFVLSSNWKVEPEGQLVSEWTDIDDTADRYATIRYDTARALRARLGVRFVGEYRLDAGELQPFAEVHVWRSFGRTDHVYFNDDALLLDHRGTELALSLGLIANTYSFADFYGRVNWSRSLDDLKYESFGGDIGIRIRW